MQKRFSFMRLASAIFILLCIVFIPYSVGHLVPPLDPNATPPYSNIMLWAGGFFCTVFLAFGIVILCIIGYGIYNYLWVKVNNGK